MAEAPYRIYQRQQNLQDTHQMAAPRRDIKRTEAPKPEALGIGY